MDLTPAQTPVVTLLVEHLERVVRYESVSAAYESAGGSSHAASLRTLLTRIGARVRPVGLELVTVRRRGVLLTQRSRVAAASRAPEPRGAVRSGGDGRWHRSARGSRTRSTSSGLSLAPSWSVTSKRSMTSPSWALTLADFTSMPRRGERGGERMEETGPIGAADLAHRVPRRRGAVEGHLGVGKRHRLDRATRRDLDVLGQLGGVGARPEGHVERVEHGAVGPGGRAPRRRPRARGRPGPW